MEVRCEFYTGDEKYWFTKAYICEVTKMPKDKSSFHIEKFVGTHEFGKGDDDVRCLIISGHTLKEFPKNLHKRFPELRFLKVKGCGIDTITQEDLIRLTNLECLSLSENKLTSLPDDLFAGTKNLRWISFYDNKIERMSSRLFEPIINTLVFADFKYNSKISEKFDKSDAKRDLEKLMRLIDVNCLPPGSRPENDKKEVCSSNQDKKHLDELSKVTTAIEIISEIACDSFLGYFYAGDLCCEAIAGIFELADFFDVTESKPAPKRKLKLNEKNALEAFKIGHQYGSDEIKHGAFKIIQKMFPGLDESFVDKKEEVCRLMALKNEIDEIMKK